VYQSAFMNSWWFQFVRKYVWNDERTPYHVSPEQMRKTQAHNEVFFYVVFEGTLVGLVTLGALIQVYTTHETEYLPVLGYGCFLLVALYFLVSRKSPWAVLYSASLPVLVFGVFFLYDFHPNNMYLDKLLLSGFLVCWLIYTTRLFKICRKYPDMEDASK
jgi:hypothetical protein